MTGTGKDIGILDRNGLTEAKFLKFCDPGRYERPSVAANMAILTVLEETEDNYRKLPEKELGILLVQRGVHPYLGFWAPPGGFVKPDETTEQAARRELREETGPDHVYMEQPYTFSDPGRDPRTWVVSCSYMALIDSSKVFITAGDDADNARWFHISFHLTDEHTDYPVLADTEAPRVIRVQHYKLELTGGSTCPSSIIEKCITKTENGTIVDYRITESNGLVLDHTRIITYALERLRGEVEYSGLAFHLMPSEFTLTQSQQIHEVILGKRLSKTAFRRKAVSLVEEMDSYTGNEGHRLSRLYRKKWKEF